MTRELDIQCAQALGWNVVPAGPAFGGGHFLQEPGHVYMSGTKEMFFRSLDDIGDYLPAFSADPVATRLLEDEIERRGLQKQYLDELAEIVDSTEFDGADYPWLLVHATPEQRARAFLVALNDPARL